MNLTHRCNFSCRYCYSGEKIAKDMSLATARKIVDFAMEITPPQQKIRFGFSGGEPLLCFELIRQITNYIRDKQSRIYNPVCLGLTSNGTLLTESILDFFSEQEFELCISLDGPEAIHNLNRRYQDGKRTFDDVVKHIPAALERLAVLQVNAVYDPQTIEFLHGTVSFLAGLGVPVIHLNPNIRAFEEDYDYSQLRESFMQIADYYIDSYDAGREIAVNLIDSKIIVFLKGGYDILDKCGMGETEWAFAPSGNIYPCERLIGEDKTPCLCMGNIHTGLDPSRRCSVIEHTGNRNEECRECNFSKYCMNWCGCTNYHMTGYTDLAGRMLCESEKAAMQAAGHVLAVLSDKNNDLFLDHFMKYVNQGRCCR